MLQDQDGLKMAQEKIDQRDYRGHPLPEYQEPVNMRGAQLSGSDNSRGAMHQLLREAHSQTVLHTENMHRLGKLFDRIEGIRPEAANGDMHKESEPNGILEAMERLNQKNMHSAEMMSHMIAKLEELI